jgi:enoyl-CoA hydratase/carnithine racemase
MMTITEGQTGWEIRDDIGILTLTAPPRNLLADPEFIPLPVLKELTGISKLKGILIYGQGKHFSAGGDLENLFRMAGSEEVLRSRMIAGNKILNFLESLDLPLVAAIRGICFGGGLEIALSCHIRICSENAVFAFPETNHNIMPGLGGTHRLPAVTGMSKALMMILGGDMINAEEALEAGIVDQVVSKDDLLSHSFGLLYKMTHDRPVPVIRSVMQALRNATTLAPEDAIREETRLFCELAMTEAIRRENED